MVSRLQQLMDEHLAAPFPESVEKGVSYGPVEPVLIGADILGWARRVAGGTRLSPAERTKLDGLRRDLVGALDMFPEQARTYYEDLVTLAVEALAVHADS